MKSQNSQRRTAYFYFLSKSNDNGSTRQAKVDTKLLEIGFLAAIIT